MATSVCASSYSASQLDAFHLMPLSSSGSAAAFGNAGDAALLAVDDNDAGAALALPRRRDSCPSEYVYYREQSQRAHGDTAAPLNLMRQASCDGRRGKLEAAASLASLSGLPPLKMEHLSPIGGDLYTTAASRYSGGGEHAPVRDNYAEDGFAAPYVPPLLSTSTLAADDFGPASMESASSSYTRQPPMAMLPPLRSYSPEEKSSSYGNIRHRNDVDGYHSSETERPQGLKSSANTSPPDGSSAKDALASGGGKGNVDRAEGTSSRTVIGR